MTPRATLLYIFLIRPITGGNPTTDRLRYFPTRYDNFNVQPTAENGLDYEKRAYLRPFLYPLQLGDVTPGSVVRPMHLFELVYP